MPPSVVTLIFPELPEPTVALICESDIIEKLFDTESPKLTKIDVDKYFPLIVILSPVVALDGENEVIIGLCKGGGSIYLNPERVASPPKEVILTSPELPSPTMAVICSLEFTTKFVAFVFPKLTLVTFMKFAPLIVTISSFVALSGLMLVITGSEGAEAQYILLSMRIIMQIGKT